MTTAPPRTAWGTSSRLASRPDGEEDEVEPARGERLGRRLLDEQLALAVAQLRPAEREEAKARTSLEAPLRAGARA